MVVSLRREAARGLLLVTVLKILGTITGRISLIILPLFLLPFDFGIFALAVVFAGILSVVGDMGMSTELVRRKKRFAEAANTAFSLRILLALGLLAASVAVGWGASIIFSEPRLALPVVVLAIGLPLQAIGMVPRIVATRALDFRRAAVPDSVGKFTGALGTIALAMFGFAYWSPVYGTVLGIAVGTVLLLSFSRWRPRWEFHSELARDVTTFGKFVMLTTFSNLVAHSLPNAIVGLFLGVAPLGYYVIAYSWGVQFSSGVSSILISVGYPVLARVSGTPARMKHVFKENIRYYGYVGAYLAVGIAVLAPMFVSALYGDVWKPAIAPMQVLAITGLLLGCSAIAGNALYAAGRPRTVFNVSWLEAGLILLLLPPATFFGGLLGASLAALVGASVLTFGLTLSSNRELGLTWADWSEVIKRPTVAGSIMAVVGAPLAFLLPSSIPNVLLVGGVISGVYVSVLQLLSRGVFLSDLKAAIRLALS